MILFIVDPRLEVLDPCSNEQDRYQSALISPHRVQVLSTPGESKWNKGQYNGDEP